MHIRVVRMRDRDNVCECDDGGTVCRAIHTDYHSMSSGISNDTRTENREWYRIEIGKAPKMT